VTRPPRARLRAGVGLALLYAAVVLATSVTTGHPVRPLFDGAGTSTPYKWVKPPWYVGNANVKPKPGSQDIPFEDGTSPLIGVNSTDSQIILNLPRGALPAHAGDTSVRATFTPLDPKKLAQPGPRLRPDGNAYRVEMTYQPSGAPVGQTTTSGNVIMIVPDEAKDILYSVDGRSWDALPTHMLGDPNTVGSVFNKPGYYLVDTELPEFTNPNKPDNKKRVLGIALVVVAVALTLGYVLPNLLRRSRAAQAAAGVPKSRGPKGRAPPPTRQVRRRKR
jgi:hypothetical protein